MYVADNSSIERQHHIVSLIRLLEQKQIDHNESLQKNDARNNKKYTFRET